jgi:hypothetical protein
LGRTRRRWKRCSPSSSQRRAEPGNVRDPLS